MRVVLFLIGVFGSMFAGLALARLSGSIGVGFVAFVAVLLIMVYLAWERREFGDEADDPRGEDARANARNAGAYSQAGHGGYFGGDGGGGFGGGCDGGGGGGSG